MRRTSGVVVAAILCFSAPLAAQDRVGVGIAPHGGTLGLGIDVAVAVHDRVNLRGGANILPFEPEFSVSDIDWAMEFQSPQFLLAVDLFLVSQFRVSGGARITGDDIAATGVFTGSVDVGGTTYNGSDVGTLRGAIGTTKVNPWIGLGWGNVARSKVGFFIDLGVAFTGSPDVTLTADGPITTDPVAGPTFNANLQTETREFEDDISEFKYYPVVQLGFSIGF